MAGMTPEQMAEMLRAMGMQSAAGGVDLEKLRERMMERSTAEFDRGGSDLETRRKNFQRMLSRTTDLARNRADAFGDGDQSPVQACVPRCGAVAAGLRSHQRALSQRRAWLGRPGHDRGVERGSGLQPRVF